MRILAVILLSAACFGQGHLSKIDWKPCQDVQDSLKEVVDKFNTDRKDGLRLEVMCSYWGDPNYKKKPEKHIELTAKERGVWKSLQESSTRAFTAESAYEKYLFAAHHVHERKLSDPCYNFVGIKVDDDFITVDPNPMLAGENCEY